MANTDRAETSREAVERFYVRGTEVKDAHGDFVHYGDYIALASERDALSARVEELKGVLDGIASYSDKPSRQWREEHPELSAKVQERFVKYGVPGALSAICKISRDTLKEKKP